MKKFIFLIGILPVISTWNNQAQKPPFHDEIEAFRKQDSTTFPSKGAILFAGSSSFRLWNNLPQYFKGYTVINRGFGGATLTDLIYYTPDIIFPYKPRQLVIYCGENDLASSDTVTARMLADKFVYLFTLVRNRYPGLHVVFVSIKPSPSRKQLIPRIKEANSRIKDFLSRQQRTAYADVYRYMVGKDGQPIGSLFLADSLHMNETGYSIWQKTIKPLLLND